MKLSFTLSPRLKAPDFEPIFTENGDFWRLYLDECRLGAKREIAVYSSEQEEPATVVTDSSITYTYSKIKDEFGNVHDVALTLNATLCNGAYDYSATIDNKSDVRVNELQYPFFTFDRINGDFKDDVLYISEGLGRRIVDPHSFTHSHHTEYIAADDKNVIKTYSYPGWISLPWMVLESGGKNLYMGFHSDVWRYFSFVTEAEPRHVKNEHFIMGICTYPAVKSGERITYDGFTVALFDSDWREAADFYKEWAQKAWLEPAMPKESVRHLCGWQRIILKHQYGAIFNDYSDLVRVYKEGAKYGIDMILLFAWWEEGMDNGYPNYMPSDELGGAQALKDAIKEIEGLGGRVVLYANGHILDYSADYYKQEGYKYTMKDIEGNDYHEHYRFSNSGTLLKFGHKTFVPACYGAKGWADKVFEIEERHLSLGSHGTFFDQLGCGFYLCFDESHAHKNRIDEDPEMRLPIIKEMSKKLNDDQWFGTEFVTDRITPIMDFTHGFGFSLEYTPDAYPYIFKYVFPNCIISNRYIHDEKKDFLKYLNYTFVAGMIFDVGIFRCRAKSVEVQPEYAKRVGELIELRKQYLDYFTLGRFDMIDGIPDRVWACKYTYDGNSIAAVWNDSDEDFIIGGVSLMPGEVKVIHV